MKIQSAQAAGQGGSEIVSAPPSRRHSDDAYRQVAVEVLAEQLLQGGILLRRCQDVSEATYADQVGALRAAARLINANAQLAKALAQVAQVERRSRTIVETIQRPDPKIAELYAAFPASLKSGEIRAVLECGLRLLLQQQKQEQKEREAPAIEYFI